MAHVLVVLVLDALLTAASLAAQSIPTTVVRVVDGDTADVRLDTGAVERRRLIGINTPETMDQRRVVECFGAEASARARELLDGQVVGVVTDPSQGERDRYGRLLAYVTLPEGRDFGKVMVGVVHHDHWAHPPFGLDFGRFQAA